MKDSNLLTDFKNNLSNYSVVQLRYISEEGVWSIGQMYDHLMLVAHEYLDNVEVCEKTEVKLGLCKTNFGAELFERSGFPPIKIRLPDEMNAPPSNSDSKEELIDRMEQLIARMSRLESKVDWVDPNRKAEHGGFGWLNALEWYELVEMHFRHHLRQKDELESRL